MGTMPWLLLLVGAFLVGLLVGASLGMMAFAEQLAKNDDEARAYLASFDETAK